MCVCVIVGYAQMKVNGFNVRICVLMSNLEIGVVNLANAVIIKSRSYQCIIEGSNKYFPTHYTHTYIKPTAIS